MCWPMILNLPKTTIAPGALNAFVFSRPPTQDANGLDWEVKALKDVFIPLFSLRGELRVVGVTPKGDRLNIDRASVGNLESTAKWGGVHAGPTKVPLLLSVSVALFFPLPGKNRLPCRSRQNSLFVSTIFVPFLFLEDLRVVHPPSFHANISLSVWGLFAQLLRNVLSADFLSLSSCPTQEGPLFFSPFCRVRSCGKAIFVLRYVFFVHKWLP